MEEPQDLDCGDMVHGTLAISSFSVSGRALHKQLYPGIDPFSILVPVLLAFHQYSVVLVLDLLDYIFKRYTMDNLVILIHNQKDGKKP